MLRTIAILFSLVFLLAVTAAGGALYMFWHYGRGLPDYHQLAHYEPPITTRVYGGDGRLVAEYAVEKRAFVPLNAIPQRIKDAFLSAEDKNFYEHAGVDPWGIARAVIVNLRNKGLGADRRPVGASTITQQVAKNFLLTNEVSLERKVKEAILAFRIERAFTKDHILELYLNEIYLGMGNYGVAAAGLNYFNRALDDLSVAEAAYLAALPKAPNNYHPIRHPQAAKERRDWVIGRMFEDGKITRAEYEAALAEPLAMRKRDDNQMIVGADYFAEDIRRDLVARYGEEALYKGGLVVRSTVDADLQAHASKVLRGGLMGYDRRHGWRGPVNRIQIGQGWQQRLGAVPFPAGGEPWELSVVLSVSDQSAAIGLNGGRTGIIPFSEMRWARPWMKDQHVGAPPRKPGDVLQPGDVVLVEEVAKGDDGKALAAGSYALRQIPKVDGALVALDPHTGRVLAMVGGWSYSKSQFTRATQALRQPGSSFKPFVYLSALENGYTPSSLVLDGPIALPQGPGLPLWRPKNYGGDFLGPTTLRVGVEKSRNLMTVRLAQAVGMDKVADYSNRFGIYDNLPKVLSMALGAGETTVLRLASAYGMLVNGGKKINPTLVDRIQDRQGRTIFVHDKRFCDGCWPVQFADQDMPRLPDSRDQVVAPLSGDQMVSILEGVVQRGTGRSVSVIGKPLAGKTGTSTDSHDVWFAGFSPDLVAVVFVGFDEPASLGDKETGGSIAAPIFRDFMSYALKDQPATPFRVPSGVRLVRVNAGTGRPAMPGDPKVILEAFKSTDPMPDEDEHVLEGEGTEGFSFQPLSEEGAAAPVGGVPGVPGAVPQSAPAAAPMPGGLY